MKGRSYLFQIVSFSTCGKKDWVKENSFHKTENPSPLYEMKNSFKNTFPLDETYLSLAGVSEKWKKNLLPLAKKTVFTSRNKVSLKKIATPNFKIFNKTLNKTVL